MQTPICVFVWNILLGLKVGFYPCTSSSPLEYLHFSILHSAKLSQKQKELDTSGRLVTISFEKYWV